MSYNKSFIENKVCRFCGSSYEEGGGFYSQSKSKKPCLIKTSFTINKWAIENTHVSFEVFRNKSAKDMSSLLGKRKGSYFVINNYRVYNCTCGKTEICSPIYLRNSIYNKQHILRKLVEIR
jgi:hypothetical protein